MHSFKVAGGCRQKPRLQMLIIRFCSNWKISTSQNCESLKNFKKPITKCQVGPCDLVLRNSCVFLGRSQVFPICRRDPLFFPQHLGSYFWFIVRQHVDNKWTVLPLNEQPTTFLIQPHGYQSPAFYYCLDSISLAQAGGWEEAALHRHGCTLYAL